MTLFPLIRNNIVVPLLKTILKQHDLSCSGNKDELFDRLESHCRSLDIRTDEDGHYMINKDNYTLVPETESADGEASQYDENAPSVHALSLNLDEDRDGHDLGHRPTPLKNWPTSSNIETRNFEVENYNSKRYREVKQLAEDIHIVSKSTAESFQMLFDGIDQINDMYNLSDLEMNFIIGIKVIRQFLVKIRYKKSNSYKTTISDINDFYGDSYETIQEKIRNFDKLPGENLIHATSRLYALLSGPEACFHRQHIRQKAKILTQIFKRIMRETFFEKFCILWVAGDDISDEYHVLTCIKKLDIVIPIVVPEHSNCQTDNESNKIYENVKIRNILETVKEYESKFSYMKEKIDKYETQMENLMRQQNKSTTQATQTDLQSSKLSETLDDCQLLKTKSQRQKVSCNQPIRYCSYCYSYTHYIVDCWSKTKNQHVNLKTNIMRRNRKSNIKCHNCLAYGHKIKECRVKIRQTEIVQEILSKRQSDILRLFSHIQYINQNDTKLLEDLFFEIEKLSQLNSMSEQEMRDIAVLKISGTILANTNYRNQNFNEIKKSLLSNKINFFKQSSSSNSAKKLLCPEITKNHHKSTFFSHSYQDVIPIDNNWDQTNLENKDKDGKSNSLDYKFVSKLNLIINNKPIEETIYKEEKQTKELQYYCSSIQAVPPERCEYLQTKYTKKLQDQKASASQKEQDMSHFTKWKAKNNLYKNYSHNFRNV